MRYKKVIITEDQMRLIYDIWQRPCNVRLTLNVYTVEEYDNDVEIQIDVTNSKGLKSFTLEYDNGHNYKPYILGFTYTNNNSYDAFVECISKALSTPRIQERIKKINASGIFEEERDIQIMTYKNSLKDGQVSWEEEL